jgi:hypothetical protein
MASTWSAARISEQLAIADKLIAKARSESAGKSAARNNWL